MRNASRIQIRLVVPRAPCREGQPLYTHIARFFARLGEPVFVQEKLLELSPSLPAILEGTVASSGLEKFLLVHPDIDKIVILTDRAAAATRAAA